MHRWVRKVSLVASVVTVVGIGGCGGDVCAEKTVDRAVAYIATHQSCETDADCVIVSDYCEAIPGGWCGQIAMSREGSASAEWRLITSEIENCAEEECSVCAGAMEPSCFQGSCGGPS